MHSDKRTTWYRDGGLALLTGFLYGGSNTLVGHPFDTVKTKMQAQAGHMADGQQSGPRYLDTIKNVYAAEGPTGFYRGWAPPFIGSVVYRSCQFTVYEAFYTKSTTYKEGPLRAFLLGEIPWTGGLQGRVVVGGVLAASARALIECPFEYAKVKRQTG